MSLTTPTIHLPDAPISVPTWLRRHLSWMLVALALVATAVLVTVALAGGSSSGRTVTSPFTERGSISAIDHRDAMDAATAAAGAGSVAPAENPARTGEVPTLLDRSISAIDHAGR